MTTTTANIDPYSHLCETHPSYLGKPLPLNRFFVHLRERYDNLKDFLGQDEINRANFLYHVLNELPRSRNARRLPLSAENINYLNSLVPIGSWPVTRIMLKVWKDEKQRFNLADQNDYCKFLFFYVDHMRNYFSYPDSLYPDFIFEFLNQKSNRLGKTAIPISIYMDELWQQRSTLHNRYSLGDPGDQVTFAFDYVMTIAIGHSNDAVLKKLIPPSLYAYYGRSFGDAGETILSSMLSLCRAKTGHNIFPAKTIRDAIQNAHPNDVLDLKPGVDVIGPYRSRSGLGFNVIQSQRALEFAKIPHALCDFSLNDATIEGAAKRDRKDASHRIKLLHIQPDNLPEYVGFFKREKRKGEYYIGFFAWETNHQPDVHLLGIDLVDEIWTPSDYVRDSFRSVTSKPVITMPHTIEFNRETPFKRSYFSLPDDVFLFHFSFDLHSWIDRKNPNGLVAAFQRAFPHDPDVHLVIKARNGANYRWISSNPLGSWEAVLEIADKDSRITILNDEMTQQEAMGLINVSDCYVSLHRSEGFGYTVAEAMYVGKPCITTGYSGNLQYCTPDTCYLVRAKETFIQPGQYIFYKGGQIWGEPDIDHAAELMRFVRNEPDEARRVGQRAKTHIETNFSLAQMSQRYSKRLSEIQKLLDR